MQPVFRKPAAFIFLQLSSMPFSSIPYQSHSLLSNSLSSTHISSLRLSSSSLSLAIPFRSPAALSALCISTASLFIAIHLLSRAFPMRIAAYRFLSVAPQFSSSPFHINAFPCLRQAVPWLRTPSYASSIPSHASSAHFTSIPRPHDHVLYSFIVSSESFSQVNFPFPEFLHWPSPRHTP